MVQLRSALERIALGQVYDNCETVLRENTNHPPGGDNATPPAKKRRLERAEAPKKRRRGGQGGLHQLNLDELYIIFAYIYPMDLLNLARTCRSLRGLLMHKSSNFLWKTALRQIEGLPDCPADLTEPEYTNLVFYIYCHGCGKSAKTVLWTIRRRYCPSCRDKRLCNFTSCDEVVRQNEVLPTDWFLIGDRGGRWADVEQMNSFMHDYLNSSDKAQFLDEKRVQLQTISSHARKCESWQQGKGRVHRFDLEVLRKDRQETIFERLKQRGYAPEIAYYRDSLIKKSYISVFKKYKPLTDSEWDRMWPKWIGIMNNFRSLRVEVAVHRPRRRLLVSRYDKYVTHPSPDSPTFDLLPHVVDLARFPPFRDVIRSPEGTQLDDKPFTSAFAQLPTLVDDWMQGLNSEIAALVKVPSWLSGDPSRDQDKVPRSTTDLDRLDLACAMFYVGSSGAFTHPEVLSVSMRNETELPTNDVNLNTADGLILKYILREDHSERTGSIHDRFGLQFLEEAPYIIYACGLDPNRATAGDMDRRNTRLRCLSCGGRALVMSWRHAIWHARFYHCIDIGQPPLSESPRWQLVADEHIDSIQAVERSVQKAFTPDWTRCLVCRPRVGDAMLYDHALRHLAQCHGLEKDKIREGTHYKLIGIRDVCVVEMVIVGEQVTFKVLQE